MKTKFPNFIEKLPSISNILVLPGDYRIIHLHYFNPIGAGNWFIMAATAHENDITLFGSVYFNQFRECYISYKELKSKKFAFNLKVERYKDFEKMSFKELKQKIHLFS